MKTSLLFLLFLIYGWNSYAQNFQLQILGSTESETKTIDSLKYNTKHKKTKSIKDEINEISKRLSQIGYIDNTTLDFKEAADSSFTAKLILGKKIKSIHIYIGSDILLNSLILLNKKNNTIELPYTNIDFFLNEVVQKLEQKGYALAKLKLTNIKKDKHTLYADLKFESEQKRKLNSILIRQSENTQSKKFPKNYLTQINKKYKNSIFNQKTVEQIHQDFKSFGFVNQVKYPEILFTKDSTRIYVYLEKKNSNTFDGFVGFSNNETKKITLNGYLDLKLENILVSGETLSLYWKTDGNDQKTFKASIELPYLFKTPIGLKTQIQVFRQDTTFQNTKTAIDLSYFANYNTRFYLGYQGTESSDIQNLNSNLISDFNNSFITTSFDFTKPETNNLTFPIKSKLFASIGIGKRKINTLSEKSEKNQFLLNIQATHTFYLNKKNSIYINSQNNYLKSNHYITNELFRFGGFNSVRGFAENSLQAYFVSLLLTEYRYIISPNLYLHTILDYSLFKNEIENTAITKNLTGIGIGMGLQTKNGLLRLAIANGHAKKQQFEIYNTITHISYNVKF